MTGSIANTSRCTGTRFGASELASFSSRSRTAIQRSQPVASGAPNVSDDSFLLIPGQLKDYCVEINLSRQPSPVESSTSSWVNLDSLAGIRKLNPSPESHRLQSHLLWFTDILMALTKRLEQPISRTMIQLSSPKSCGIRSGYRPC